VLIPNTESANGQSAKQAGLCCLWFVLLWYGRHGGGRVEMVEMRSSNHGVHEVRKTVMWRGDAQPNPPHGAQPSHALAHKLAGPVHSPATP
jgi:hypothetical protein